MSNVVDYVKWRGDLPFSKVPLNVIDNLVLAQLSYIDFRGVLTEDNQMTFAEAYEKLTQQGEIIFTLVAADKENLNLAKECAESVRFGQMVLSDYVDIIDQKVEKQFSAVIFHLDDGSKYIGYRGTDNSIVGWKEDFMISYTRVESQQTALRYAKDHIGTNESVYIGGHSKGAHLALYTATYLPQTKNKQVKRVFLNDGPGLCPDVQDVAKMERIAGKTVRVKPVTSIVGRIFEPQIGTEYIVKSDAFQVMQHSIVSWQLEYGKLALVDAHDSTSDFIKSNLDKFIEGKNLHEREEFVESLFGGLLEGGAKTLKDFVKEGPSGLEALFRSLSAPSKKATAKKKAVTTKKAVATKKVGTTKK